MPYSTILYTILYCVCSTNQFLCVTYIYTHTSSLFSLRVVNGRLHGLYQPPFGEDEILEGVALLVGLQDDLLHSGGDLLPLHHHRQLHRSNIDMACSTRFIHVPLIDPNNPVRSCQLPVIQSNHGSYWSYRILPDLESPIVEVDRIETEVLIYRKVDTHIKCVPVYNNFTILGQESYFITKSFCKIILLPQWEPAYMCNNFL